METINEIFLLGVGHNTPVFIDLAEQCGYRIMGLYHYDESRTGETEHGFQILGSFNDLLQKEDLKGMCFLMTMGDNVKRTDISNKLRKKSGKTPTLIHPTAVVSRFAKIDQGVCISAFTHIQADSYIGQDTIVLSGVNISHNNTLGQGCFIAGGATIGAYTEVGDLAFIGQGVLTISAKVKHIGDSVYVGAGALVTKSIPPNDIVKGHPSRSIKNS
nr:hypothetical protein [uncultured Draconibacterium sp.]